MNERSIIKTGQPVWLWPILQALDRRTGGFSIYASLRPLNGYLVIASIETSIKMTSCNDN